VLCLFEVLVDGFLDLVCNGEAAFDFGYDAVLLEERGYGNRNTFKNCPIDAGS
jgi:hypothetical protein